MYKKYTNKPGVPNGYIQQILLIMRLTTIILITAIMQVSASTFAQRITLAEKNTTLRKVFDRISDQSGYNFIFTSDLLNGTKPVTIKVKNMELDKVLEQIFTNQPVSFSIEDRTVIVKIKEKSSFLDNLIARFQTIDVRGKILDENAEPLAGATIAIKGRGKSVRTNAKGEFYLQNVGEKDKLVISYIGYQTMEVDAMIDMGSLTMVVANEKLEEVNVVFTGYQKLPAERVTGSFSVINERMIDRRVGTDLIGRLEDMSSGLAFNRSGKTSSTFNIRGQNTLYASSKPLIVIDNFPYEGDLSTVNPNDVETVTLLKDAAAASIWGARAGNGVLVITTKKGKLDAAPKVTFNSNLTIGAKRDLFSRPRISMADYIDLEQSLFGRDFYKNIETAAAKTALSPIIELLILKRDGKITTDELNIQIARFRTQDIRSQQAEFLERKSSATQISLNVTGGGKTNSYYLSTGYDRNLANLVGNSYKRLTFNAQNTYHFNSKLEVNLGLNFARSITDNNVPAFFSPYPYGTLQDDSGNPTSVNRYLRAVFINDATAKGLLDWQYRPLQELALSDNKTRLSDYRINTGLKYKIIPALSAEVLYNYSGSIQATKNIQSPQSYAARDIVNRYTEVKTDGTFFRAVPMGGLLDQNNNTVNNQSLRTQLNFSNQFGQKHSLTSIAGAEIREMTGESNVSRVYGYQDEYGKGATVDYLTRFKQYQNPASSLVIPNADNTDGVTDRYLSYYVNAAYTYDQRYTVSTSARLDQSNLFGVKANQKGVPLYSVGGAWNISSEGFYKLDWLPYLKFRSTYGYNGNTSRIYSAFITASLINGTSSPIGQPYASITNPPNPELRWERVRMINLGLDFASRLKILSGSIEYYFKNSKDLLGVAPFPFSTGIQIFRGNVANTKGSGLDLTLNASIINSSFKWESTGLLSISRDEVTAYQASTIGTGFLNGSLSPTVGRPLYGISSYAWAGLDPATGDPRGYLNGTISKDYAKIIGGATLDNVIFNGSAIPVYYGSLRNTFSYGSLSLSVLISYRLGYYFHRESVIYGTNYGLGSSVSGPGTHGDYGKRWRTAGEEANTTIPSAPASIITGRDDFYTYSNILTEKGDHIRLQDIRLSYDLSGIKRKLPFSNLSVYGYANNIGLIWKANKSNIDPDYQLMPLPFTISIGLKAAF
jgi:TonB-linked SusC/RagA family outer membrane protein